MNIDFSERCIPVLSGGSNTRAVPESFFHVWTGESTERISWTRQGDLTELGVGFITTNSRGYHLSIPSEVKFAQLVKQWNVERNIVSSLSEIAMCPSYLMIIAMGETALPLIIAQLKREGDDPDHWFVALEAITGNDPIPEEAYGDTLSMAEAWLSWAEEENVW